MLIDNKHRHNQHKSGYSKILFLVGLWYGGGATSPTRIPLDEIVTRYSVKEKYNQNKDKSVGRGALIEGLGISHVQGILTEDEGCI